jgi:hypothetical protein
MSFREEIDRAPSDMSTNSSADNSFIMEETTTMNPVEYTKDKIFEFLDNRGDKDIISSVNDRYCIAEEILYTFSSISIENQNNILIAVLLSIFNEYEWINFKFDIKVFTNVPTYAIEEMLYLITNKSNSSYESYKLIPRYVSILINSSSNTIMNIIDNTKTNSLYNELNEYIDMINKYKIDIDSKYIKDIYNMNRDKISEIDSYMKKNKSIDVNVIKNILNISSDS